MARVTQTATKDGRQKFTVISYEIYSRSIEIEADSPDDALTAYETGDYEGTPSAPEYWDDYDYVRVQDEEGEDVLTVEG